MHFNEVFYLFSDIIFLTITINVLILCALLAITLLIVCKYREKLRRVLRREGISKRKEKREDAESQEFLEKPLDLSNVASTFEENKKILRRRKRNDKKIEKRPPLPSAVVNGALPNNLSYNLKLQIHFSLQRNLTF